MSPMNPLPMTTLKRTDAEGNEVTHITVFFSSGDVKSCDSTHPQFDTILTGATTGDESIIDLFSISKTVEKRFERLSERITVRDGEVRLDEVPLHNSLTDAILRALNEGEDDWRPLVKFFERLLANPNEHSREQLYTWLASESFTINEDGLIVGYKYVYNQGDDPENPGTTLYTSTVKGYAIVDDVEHGTPDSDSYSGDVDYVPNRLGSVITMPRDLVQHDPSVACHKGLHVGTWGYSGNSTRDVLTVLVDPRDVVSVPTDSYGGKIRCCRYIVLDVNDGRKHEGLILHDPVVEDDEPPYGENSDVPQYGRSSWGFADEPVETIHGFPVGARIRAIKCPGAAPVGTLATVDKSAAEPPYSQDYFLGGRAVIPVVWDDHSEGNPYGQQNDGEYYVDYFELVEDEVEEDDFDLDAEDVEDALDSLSDAADLIGDAVNDLRDAFGRYHRGRPGSARGANGRFVKAD